MGLRKDSSFPLTRTRLKANISLSVGLDVEDILGLGSAVTETAIAVGTAISQNTSQLIAKNLQPFASCESMEISQNRSIYRRYALSKNPVTPFQTIPFAVSTGISIDVAVLNKMTDAEKLFSFSPNNLAFQQLPFIIQAISEDPTGGDDSIVYYFLGCWFEKNVVRFDVQSKDDQRLIRRASIAVSDVLVYDSSYAGNATANIVAGVATGLMSGFGTPAPSDLLSSPITF